jgi:hypothetical protein
MWKFVVRVGDVESHCKIRINAETRSAASGAPGFSDSKTGKNSAEPAGGVGLSAVVDYEWNPCAMICKGDNMRYLDFILRCKSQNFMVLVKRVPLDGLLDMGACKVRMGDVEIYYGVVMDSLIISVVRLYAFRNVATSILYNKIGNKVVACAKGACGAHFYLGRCQKYEARGLLHSYYWYSSPQDDAFKGISPRNESTEDLESLKEAALDVALLKAMDSPLAGKPLLSIYPYYPDNSVYENQQRRLPIALPAAKTELSIDFYNFKHIPPKHARVLIKQDDFVVVNALSRQSQSFNIGFINKDVTDAMVLQLFFEKDKTTGAITITSLALKGENEQAFEFV